MRYRIRHITEYLYTEQVNQCYNLGYQIPRATARQKCLGSHVNVRPDAAFSSQRQDYFGNKAYHFEIQRPHQQLLIESTSEVITAPQTQADAAGHGILCDDSLARLKLASDPDTLLAREFVLDSPIIQASTALRDYASCSFHPQRPLLEAVAELTERVFQEFTYCPVSTTVATPLEEVLANRRGVCQDFAHLEIGCLRSLGFAAKYVSGYIETQPPPGKEKLVGADATHAWISVYLPTVGWVEFDPTNNCQANEQHIVTAWGRDYFDVTPLRGVIYGGGEKPVLNVSVDVSRVEV